MPKQRYPEPTVGALIVNRRGEILLIRSHKWRDCYVIPGGHVELGERLEEALAREIREETGLAIDDARMLCVQEFVYDDAFWKRRHFIFLDYVCRTDGDTVTLNDEAQTYAWVAPQAALDMPVEPYTAHAIRAYLRQLEGGVT
ncbi:MAG: NUDIX domain-containing protein [Anaerolineae bacterium]|nr:NUDIX domain-containing protein [Anaerolineae bacterium]